jgi:hypothetical protein
MASTVIHYQISVHIIKDGKAITNNAEDGA